MRCLAIFLTALLQVAILPAAGTRSWELSRYGDYLAGTFENVALDREGSLRVAPSLDTVHESEQAVLWSIARAADGTVYFGTGHQGAVFKVSPEGQGELLWKAPEIEVFALASGPDGYLYAGTSPNGKVYKVSSDGESEVFFDPGEKYVWSLLFDAEGHLIVGTGDGGKIYRVGTDGKGSAWFESGQRHVMSLALDSSRHVLAGTDPEGILYRVAEDGTAFGLYDSDLPEIRSVAVSEDGSIYFAAMGGGMDRLLQAIPGGQAVVSVQAPGRRGDIRRGNRDSTGFLFGDILPDPSLLWRRARCVDAPSRRPGRREALVVQRGEHPGVGCSRRNRSGRAIRDGSGRSHLCNWQGPQVEPSFRRPAGPK